MNIEIQHSSITSPSPSPSPIVHTEVTRSQTRTKAVAITILTIAAFHRISFCDIALLAPSVSAFQPMARSIPTSSSFRIMAKRRNTGGYCNLVDHLACSLWQPVGSEQNGLVACSRPPWKENHFDSFSTMTAPTTTATFRKTCARTPTATTLFATARNYPLREVKTRLYSSSNRQNSPRNEDDSSSGLTGKIQKFFSKAAQKVQSILPPSWVGNRQRSQADRSFDQQEEDENRSIRKSAQKQVSSSLDSFFQDSPLGIRLMGNMIVKPLFTSLAGSLAQTMQDQQREMNDLLMDARTCIVNDSNLVMRLGGEPIQVNAPFQQSSSSSTVSVNGRMETRSRVEASFEVLGGGGSGNGGIATMVAVNGMIESLYVKVGGAYYKVNVATIVGDKKTSSFVVEQEEELEGTRGSYDSFFSTGGSFGKRSSSASASASTSASTSTSATRGGLGKNHNMGKDNVIDAEFVDKKVYKNKNDDSS